MILEAITRIFPHRVRATLHALEKISTVRAQSMLKTGLLFFLPQYVVRRRYKRSHSSSEHKGENEKGNNL